jgi:hypothetical protein
MKKPKAPKLVTVAIFTTITIVAWIFFSVYRILTNEPPVTVSEKILAPINPQLDTKSLDRLDERIYFEEGEVVALPTPTPEEESVEQAEEEVVQVEEEETQSEEATPSSTSEL